MYYFVAAFGLFIILGLFYRIILPSFEPDFELMGHMNDESLRASVMNLAGMSRQTKERGKGLSVGLIAKKVKKAFGQIKQRVDAGEQCQDFELWIYDNYYKIAEAVSHQRRLHFTYTQLPSIRELPRLYHFLKTVVKASGGSFTAQQLKELTLSYCAVTPLTFAEINNLKNVLEFCILEYIAIFCSKSIVIASKIRRARLDAKRERVSLTDINYNSYVFGMDKYAGAPLKRGFDELCRSGGLKMRQRIDNFYRQTSAYTGSLQAAITNLHALSKLDDQFIIELSPLHELLCQQDSGFNDCTLATKYVYLANIARRARRKKLTELAHARRIMDKAVAEGRDIAEYILPVCRSRSRMRLYIFATLFVSLAVTFCVSYFVFGKIWWTFFLFFPIFLGVVLIALHEFLGVAVKRRYLPRKKLTKDQAASHKTMILFSRLIADEGEVDDAFSHLETIRYANPDKLFSYGILIDLPASTTKELSESEQKIVQKIKQSYENLAEKSRYNIFLRSRTLIKGGNKYQGWEKKRGALLELNNLILSKTTIESSKTVTESNQATCKSRLVINDSDFSVQDSEKLARFDAAAARFDTILGDSFDVKYVIALDSDTLLCFGRELVEIMEHPYNKEKSVVSVSIATCPASAEKSFFARLFCGGVGIGSYSELGANASFDIFGHGNYTGKGIYRVREFQEKVQDMFMDNRILSHDFIEGAIAGCANSRERALDSFPSTFSAFVQRGQRWLRGDWQLLPYLFFKVKNREGKVIKNPLKPIDKWHIFCNLALSLIPIATMLTVFLSLAVAAGWDEACEPVLLGRLLLLVAFLPNIIYILNSLRLSTLFHPTHAIAELLRQAYNIASMPIIAVYSLYSISVTIVRLFTKKKLLEWKVFAHTKGKVSFLPCILSAVIVTTISIIFGLDCMYYIIAGIFLLAPIAEQFLSKERIAINKSLCKEDARELFSLAQKTWSYFKRQFDSGMILPADNYQEHLDIGYIRRTSPTNIGMTLASICSAFTLSIIDYESLEGYIEAIITKLEEAEKWHGNLYNWIDSDTLMPLMPRYVSTVDSGNLLAGLLLSTCYVRHNTLKERIFGLIDEMEIEKLFDFKRGLFSIGYNETTKEMDQNHYDLLASEAALTYLISIGLGKIDKSAFYNLSRQHVKYCGAQLYSWTGGMFEYLMPSLFFGYKNRTVLGTTAKRTIAANIKFAKKSKHKFWGISECQYNATDDNGLYQYKAFGVPSIALASFKPPKVFSPYASILALPFEPKKVFCNIKSMQDFFEDKSNSCIISEQGFYESVDDGEVLRTYMTHHQGMILCSIAQFLSGGGLNDAMRISPAVRAAELLLFEPQSETNARKKASGLRSAKKHNSDIEKVDKHYIVPRLNLLSGGRYHLAIDEHGRGYSLYDDIYLSRPDTHDGLQIYAEIDGEKICLSDPLSTTKTGSNESALQGFDGTQSSQATHSFFSTNLSKSTKKLSSCVTAYVLPNSSGEVRDIRLKNLTDEPLDVSVVSYMEVALAKKDDYIAHRAYSNMFLHSEFDETHDMEIITRKGKKYPYFAHYFSQKGASYTANRADFFVRTHGKERFDAHKSPKDCRFGSRLDTVVSGRIQIRLEPLKEQRFQIFCLASYDLGYLKRQAKITRSGGFLMRASGECFAISKQSNPDQGTKRTASKLLYQPKPVKASLAQLGINTDIPLIILPFSPTISESRLEAQLTQLAKLYKFDIAFNTVILYNERHSYYTHSSDTLNEIISDVGLKAMKNAKSTVLIINQNQTSDQLIADLEASKTDIEDPLSQERITPKTSIQKIQPKATEQKNSTQKSTQKIQPKATEQKNITSFLEHPKYQNARLESPRLDLELGIGGFLQDGSYFLDISERDTPAPWSNIIANSEFGTLITESGGGYTYAENSRENKLTSWSNDSLLDPPSESVVLQEDDVAWSITKKPITTKSSYHVIHARGYSEFYNNFGGIVARERQFIHKNTKFFDIALDNQTDDVRKISVAFIAEAVLGTHLCGTSAHLEFAQEGNKIVCTNTRSGKRCYIDSSLSVEESAFFRESFSGEDGQIDRACGFRGNGRKKAAAISTKLEIKPRASERIIFSLGTDALVNFCDCDKYFRDAKSYYGNLVKNEISLGDKQLDYLLKWLPYQVLSSRFFARTGFYQAGGAKGFRDQLQDCLALLYVDTGLVREHILDAAAHQFEDGDVQHWWHSPSIGVRTRISDDKLFLPFITAEYIDFCLDKGILKQRIPFLKNIPLSSDSASVYAAAEATDYESSLYAHCMAAIKSAIAFRSGGLLLMGGGDWNDAMDEIGAGGKGTTVWGSMFLYYVLGRFLPFVEGDDDRLLFEKVRSELKEAVDGAWDGEWFLRAFTDDGRKVGAGSEKECQIDLITQSWAVLSGIASQERCEKALMSAHKRLVDYDNGIIRLLDPPFCETQGIGYISHYPKGVRENGGQYTHAAVWYILSLIKAGKTDLAKKLLTLINPINKTKTTAMAEIYALEPYVIAADVYAGEQAGRGGWSWYTGAASWLYKCLKENKIEL